MYVARKIFFTCLISILVFGAQGTAGKTRNTNKDIPEIPGRCNKASVGKQTVIKDRNGDAKLLICYQNGKTLDWKMIDENSYGNSFDPGKDCADILDNLPTAESGVYWIKTDMGPKKAWCDMMTDGGGFMLIGVKDSPVSWDVPSHPSPVYPLDSRKWSSSFGDMQISDFRVQISTSKSFSNTKVHWFYRFNSPRTLTNLLLRNKGGCSGHYPGVGDVSFVKDLRTNKIVTKQFRCSRFGSHFNKRLGWGKMNECLGSPCKKGFGYLKLSTTGSFSYSVVSSKSGVRNNAAAFIGCDEGKCCACYGPNSDQDYCAPKCQSVNGGTVVDKNSAIHVWFWVRTSLPKRVWKRCMEYEKTEQGGKIAKWHVDEESGIPRKGPCSYRGDVRLNSGVAVVNSNKSLQKIPNVEGLLSYRTDNRKLYLRGKHRWNEIALAKEVTRNKKDLEKKLLQTNAKLTNLFSILERRQVFSSCKDARRKFSQNGVYRIQTKTPTGFNLVYCQMTGLTGCSRSGWTLAMKTDGRKETFSYSSSYWRNKMVYNPVDGQSGLDSKETKLPTYWSTPFTELCLGMKVGSDVRFISINYRANSLYDLIADGNYRQTSVSYTKWKSLIRDSSMQTKCGRQGFNVRADDAHHARVRIGIIGNEVDSCWRCDSFVGYGGLKASNRHYCGTQETNTCGNSAKCSPDNGDKETKAMGYIFVR